jgi:hypothetical protein
MHHPSTSSLVCAVIAVASSTAHAGAPSPEREWQEYRDDGRKLVVYHPPDGRVTTKTSRYVVIQNYESDDHGVAPKGRYYIEIHLHDQPGSCENMTKHPKKIKIGRTDAMASLGEDGGDSGGRQFVICAPRKDHIFSVVVSENDAKGRVAKRVLASVRFLDE